MTATCAVAVLSRILDRRGAVLIVRHKDRKAGTITDAIHVGGDGRTMPTFAVTTAMRSAATLPGDPLTAELELALHEAARKVVG